MKRLGALTLILAGLVVSPALAHERAYSGGERLTRPDIARDVGDWWTPLVAHDARVIYGSPIPSVDNPPSASHPLTGISADGLASYNVLSSPARYLLPGGVLRIIVNADNTPADTPQILAYARNAEADGDRLLLVIQWFDGWNWGHVLWFYHQALHLYASLRPWAVAIGNEQDLSHWAPTGQQYAADWRVLEPLVRREWPRAIRVAFELSPRGLPFAEAAAKAGLPGVQAFSGHPYQIWANAFTWPQFLRLARRYHVQAWETEGLLKTPWSWPNCAYNAAFDQFDPGYYRRQPCKGYTADLGWWQLRGASVEIAWMIGSRELGPGSPPLPPPGSTT